MSYIGNPPISVAFLTDTFSGNGSTVAFTMQVAPANTSSILVVVTGVTQDPSTYSVVGTTLTFSAAPPTGTNNISVRYLGIPASGVTTTAYRTVTEFTTTDGQTTFSVPSYTVGYIDVYRSGSQLGSADYTASNGTTVVLAAAATAGELVRIVSFYVSSVLNAIPATAGAVNSTYIAGGAALANIGAGGLTQSYVGTNVAGTGPAFSAYPNATQTISQSTATKVLFQTEEFDTNSNFANSTFTPTVAGYYLISACIEWTSSQGSAEQILQIYKNGSSFKIIHDTLSATYSLSGSALVYLNGSTDYVELYAYTANAGTRTINLGSSISFFQGSMVRSA